MKFISKIDLILDDDTLMERSEEVIGSFQKCKAKRGKKFNTKDEWRIIDSQIKKKLKNPTKVGGVCTCDDNILCKHRKTYMRKAINGG